MDCVPTLVAVAKPTPRLSIEDRRQQVVRLGAWSLAFGGGLTALVAVVATGLGWARALDQCCTSVGYVGGGLQASLHVLVLGGFIALWVAGVCGRGWLALTGVGLAIAGHFLFVPAEIVFRIAPRFAIPIFTIAAPLSATGLVIAGVAAFRARLWRRWQSVTLLAAGVYIPLIQIPSFVITKGPNPIAIAGWNILEVAIAVALLQWSNDERRVLVQDGRAGSRQRADLR